MATSSSSPRDESEELLLELLEEASEWRRDRPRLPKFHLALSGPVAGVGAKL